MKSDDVEMLRAVQKNSSMAIKAIQTISEYVHDAGLSRSLYGQKRVFEDIRNRAVDRLLQGGEEVSQNSALSEAMLSGGIHMNTMLNTSTGHIAELMIKGNQRGVTSMWKELNHRDGATRDAVELAEELTSFEQSCMEQMRNYL